MDNVIQAHEIIHSLKSQKKAGMIIQLDLAKSHDRLSWIYMEKMLVAYGFDAYWIKWVMALVTSPSFSILLNGAPAKPFYPSRGIFQGYPLSPFLFVIIMEGLSRSIKAANNEGEISGLKPH
jgi:hypothetical protein